MEMNVQELRTRLQRARQNLENELNRIAAGGPRDAGLLASLRSMVNSHTEELCLIDPAAKRQRMNSNAAESSSAGPIFPAAAPHIPAPRAAAYNMQYAANGRRHPPAPPTIDKKMKTPELLAMISPGRPEAQRLQALQVLAVRAAVMQKEQQAHIMDAPNALAHITVLLYHEQAPMRQAAATCLGNLTEHRTRLATTQGVLIGLVTLLKDSCKLVRMRMETVRALLKLTHQHTDNLALLKAVPGIEPAVAAVHTSEPDAEGKKVDCKKTVQLANKLLKRLQGKEEEGKRLHAARLQRQQEAREARAAHMAALIQMLQQRQQGAP